MHRGEWQVTLQHTKDILEEAAGALDDIVKTTVYLIAGQDRSRFAAAYRKFFNRYSRSSTKPAGLTVEVRELSPRCLVEIDAVAYLGNYPACRNCRLDNLSVKRVDKANGDAQRPTA